MQILELAPGANSIILELVILPIPKLYEFRNWKFQYFIYTGIELELTKICLDYWIHIPELRGPIPELRVPIPELSNLNSGIEGLRIPELRASRCPHAP